MSDKKKLKDEEVESVSGGATKEKDRPKDSKLCADEIQPNEINDSDITVL